MTEIAQEDIRVDAIQKLNIVSFYKDNGNTYILVMIFVKEYMMNSKGEWKKGKIWYIADKNKFYYQIEDKMTNSDLIDDI